MEMKNDRKAKSHPIIAGIVDYYLLNAILMTLIVLFNSIIGRSLLDEISVIIGILILVMPLIVIVIYYALFAKKVGILSFGEVLTGRVIEMNDKVWTNPYYTNRLGIFIVILISVISIGNIWTRSSDGYIYTLPQIVGGTIGIAIRLKALILIGRRDLNGLLILIGLSTLSGVIMFIQSTHIEMRVFGSITSATMAILYSVVYIIYKRVIKKQIENSRSKHELQTP